MFRAAGRIVDEPPAPSTLDSAVALLQCGYEHERSGGGRSGADVTEKWFSGRRPVSLGKISRQCEAIVEAFVGPTGSGEVDVRHWLLELEHLKVRGASTQGCLRFRHEPSRSRRPQKCQPWLCTDGTFPGVQAREERRRFDPGLAARDEHVRGAPRPPLLSPGIPSCSLPRASICMPPTFGAVRSFVAADDLVLGVQATETGLFSLPPHPLP